VKEEVKEDMKEEVMVIGKGRLKKEGEKWKMEMEKPKKTQEKGTVDNE